MTGTIRCLAWIFLVLTAFIAISGCSKPTSILLTIETELAIPKDMDSLYVEITENGEKKGEEEYQLDHSMPLTLFIYPGRDESYEVHIAVEGRLDGIKVASGETDATFVVGEESKATVRIKLIN